MEAVDIKYTREGLAGETVGLVCLGNEVHSSWKRRVILRRYAHTEQVLFALKAGETIMAVKHEHNTLCFMVGNYSTDERE